MAWPGLAAQEQNEELKNWILASHSHSHSASSQIIEILTKGNKLPAELAGWLTVPWFDKGWGGGWVSWFPVGTRWCW